MCGVALVSFNRDLLNRAASVFAEEAMFQFVEVIRRVADVVMGVAALGAAVQQDVYKRQREKR